MNYNLFTGENIKLTAPREGDAAIMQTWYEDVSFLRNLDTDIARPRLAGDIREKLESTVRSKNDVHFQIRLLNTDALIGFIILDGIQWANGCCMLGIGIGPETCRGKGYGSEAMRLTLRYAFDELNLHRVGLNFLSYNSRAQRVYERLGFRHEGALREYIHRDGKYYDLVNMGILRPEWQALQTADE